ncbi:uncharacterized protein [Odocoileus virginianus]|uniref:Uncharacterized protein n=1 Tax=Odocoileus virginianus TaxID=9874 RepID=A0ABM4I5W6_ODOVR
MVFKRGERFLMERFGGEASSLITGTPTARRNNLVLRIRKQYILTWTLAEDRLGPRKPARGFQKLARGSRITTPGPPACLLDCNRLQRSEHAQFAAVGVGRGTDSGQEAGPRHLAGSLAHPRNPQPRQNSRDLARMGFWKEGSQPERLPPQSIVFQSRPRLSVPQAILFFPAPCEPALPACIRSHRAHSGGSNSALFVSWEALNTTHQTKPWLVASSLKNVQEIIVGLTCVGSSKKQESSRKTSTSALLTMPKPLTVWITANCGKF